MSGYRFGDGTRWLLGKVSGAVTSVTGKDTYQFGDLTKALFGAATQSLGKVFHDWTPPSPESDGYRLLPETKSAEPDAARAKPEHPVPARRPSTGAGAGSGAGAGAGSGVGAASDVGAGGGAGAAGASGGDRKTGDDGGGTGVASPPTPLCDAFAARPVVPTLSRARGTVPLDDIWGSFFRSTAELAAASVKAGVLPRDAVDDEEPFLYIGLSGLTLLEAVIRSAGSPGLVMSHGIAVGDETVPEEMKELYTALLKAKREFEAALPVTYPELEFVRQTVLFAGDRKASVELPAGERHTQLLHIVSSIQSVATCVTQLGFYLTNFADVLERVLEQCPADDA